MAPRKKQEERTEATVSNTTEVETAPPSNEQPAVQSTTAEPTPAEATTAEAPKKEWVKRRDPFGIQSIKWDDGYRISLKESDSNREIYVQFGSGNKADLPKSFEAIKKLFREIGMHWDIKVMGWAKGLKLGMTPLIREDNKKVRSQVEDAFYKAIELEEAARGPSLSDMAKERSAMARG
jgi:hypothetical protein